jgi:archaellum component FlaC
MDHFVKFSYDHFLRNVIHADVSTYIEITSIVFTMGVPFFYGLYKRRENQLEEKAVRSGGGVQELEEARRKNDLRCILYYSLMAVFVVLILFIQSNIINASKSETSRLENQLFLLQKQIEQSNEQLNRMSQRLAHLDSVLSVIAKNDRRAVQALNELRELKKTTLNLDTLLATASIKIMNDIKKRRRIPNKDFQALSSEIKRLEKEFEQLQSRQSEYFGKQFEMVRANLEEIQRSLKQLLRQYEKFPRQYKTAVIPSTGRSLTPEERVVLRRLLNRYIYDFENREGRLPSHVGENSDQILPRFRLFLQRSGTTMEEFQNEILKNKRLIERALEAMKQGELVDLGGGELKIRWLLFFAEQRP